MHHLPARLRLPRDDQPQPYTATVGTCLAGTQQEHTVTITARAALDRAIAAAEAAQEEAAKAAYADATDYALLAQAWAAIAAELRGQEDRIYHRMNELVAEEQRRDEDWPKGSKRLRTAIDGIEGRDDRARCQQCDRWFPRPHRMGQIPRYCSEECRQAAQEADRLEPDSWSWEDGGDRDPR